MDRTNLIVLDVVSTVAGQGMRQAVLLLWEEVCLVINQRNKKWKKAHEIIIEKVISYSWPALDLCKTFIFVNMQ